MKRIKLLTILLALTIFFAGASYGFKPYDERPDDFTARMEWNIEFVTNYIPPWHLPNEENMIMIHRQVG